MIGYYVHHSGRGHLHRATSIAERVRDEVTGLSSLPRPTGWLGSWVQLEPDDAGDDTIDPSASGHLHWAPMGDPGVSRRAAQLSCWLDAARPSVFVSDVSVEAALLARLHGVPVVTVALPGMRADPAHELGYGISRRIIGAWPSSAGELVTSTAASGRVIAVGAISRFPVVDPPTPARKRVVVLSGAGGAGRPFPLAAARRQTPDWHWDVLGPGSWVEEPWSRIRDAALVVAHAGQNALAEVAAARRPAIVIPQDRPFDEQLTTARALASGAWPVTVLERTPTEGWHELVSRTAALDGALWQGWNDGDGASRAARVIESAAGAR